MAENADLILRIAGDASEALAETRRLQQRLNELQQQIGEGYGAEQAEALAVVLQEAGQQAEDLTARARDGAEAVGDLGEARRGVDLLGQVVAKAGTEVAKLERLSSGAGRGFGQLSQQTRAAAESGSEAGKRIAEAFAAVEGNLGRAAEGIRAADLAFDKLGGSPAEFLGSANNEAERLVVLMAEVAKSIRKVEEESREGAGSFADFATKGRQRVDELRQSLERIPGASQEIRDEVKRLGADFDRAVSDGTDRVVKLEVEQQKFQRVLGQSIAAQKLAAGEALQLTDLLPPKFAAAALAVGGVTAGLFAVVEGLKKVDEISQSAFDTFLVEAEAARLKTLEVLAARQKLKSENIDFADSEEGIADAIELSNKAAERGRKLLDQLLGFSTNDAVAEVNALSDGFERFSDEIAKSPELQDRFVEALQRVEQQATILGDRLDSRVRKRLAELREEYERLIRVSGQTVDSIQEQVDALALGDEGIYNSIKALEELQAKVQGTSAEWGDFSDATSEGAEAVVAAIDEILRAIDLLDEQGRDFYKETREELEKTREAALAATDQEKEARLKATEEALEAFKKAETAKREEAQRTAEAIRSSLEQIAQSAASADQGGGDLAQQIEARRAEIAALEQQTSVGTATLQQNERLAEAQQELTDLQRDFRQANGQAYDEWLAGSERANQSQERSRDLIRDLVAGNEAFRDTYRQLDQASREAIGNQLSRLDQLAEAGSLTQEDVAAAGRRLQEVFERSGIEIEDVGVSLSDLGGATSDLAMSLRSLDQAATTSFGGLQDAADEALKKPKELGEKIDEVANKLADLEKRAKEVFASLRQEVESLAEPLQRNLTLCIELDECLKKLGEGGSGG